MNNKEIWLPIIGLVLLSSASIILVWLANEILINNIIYSVIFGSIILFLIILGICITIQNYVADYVKNNTIKKIQNLERQVNDLRNFCFGNDKDLDQLREYLLWRQYLIDTNFMGKLKNSKLKKESVDSFDSNSYMTAKEIFKHFKEQTISFENVHRPIILLNYIGKLLELEDKQKELDKYVDKPKMATSAKSSSNIKSTNKKEKEENE